ncbi:hypothetical protein ACHAWF_001867, partial [Thalassiosira exigua]
VAPGVTKIGDRAFSGHFGLREVDLGNVTQIGAKAFWECRSLVHVRIPPAVAEIGDDAFWCCSALKTVEFCERLQTIGTRAFEECNSLEHLDLPSTETEIGYSTFAFCGSLRDVTLAEGRHSIGPNVFESCTSLEVVTLRGSFTNIGKVAFCSCTSLRAVQLCEGVHHIGKGAFAGCTSLTCINIPPNSFVVEWGYAPSFRFVRGSTIIPDVECIDHSYLENDYHGLLTHTETTVVSVKLEEMSPQLFTEVEEGIERIIKLQHRSKEETLELLHNLVTHYELLDAGTKILKHAIRKSSFEAQDVESIVIPFSTL